MRSLTGPPIAPFVAYAKGVRLRFTIEARQLTYETTQRPRSAEPETTLIEAASSDDAITKFVIQSDCELVSLTRPLTGRESIATVKAKDDSVILVRVYAA